jgi:diacylglycerol O-acyltransferase / wax synthase
MSRVDTAWLRMDNDVNLMMIVGVWLLTPAITLEALRERIADKLLQVRPLPPEGRGRCDGRELGRRRPPSTSPPRGAEPLVREPGESERHALQRLCGELATTPLDPPTRCGSSTWSSATKAAARWWRASTTASATASR